jgi:hypothetical protein
MTTPTPVPPPDVPGAHERARLNAALLATGAETGFWDDHGNPAPWPDDINDWTPDTHQSDTHGPANF